MRSIVKRVRDKWYYLKRKKLIIPDANNYSVQCYGNEHGGFYVCMCVQKFFMGAS